jgi:small subunit ribosomal protein S30e
MPTHGSLTKAGKVRAQTPLVIQTSKKNATIPRTRNRSKYKRLVYPYQTQYRRRR